MNRWSVLDLIPTWKEGEPWLQLNTNLPATPTARFLRGAPEATLRWRRVRGVMVPCDPAWTRMTDYYADPDVTLSDTVFQWGPVHFPYFFLIFLEFVDGPPGIYTYQPGPVFSVLNTWPPPVCPVCNATTEVDITATQGDIETPTITITNTLEEV